MQVTRRGEGRRVAVALRKEDGVCLTFLRRPAVSEYRRRRDGAGRVGGAGAGCGTLGRVRHRSIDPGRRMRKRPPLASARAERISGYRAGSIPISSRRGAGGGERRKVAPLRTWL